jgi:hypothetical protein
MRTTVGWRWAIGALVCASLASSACNRRPAKVSAQQLAPVGRTEIARIALMPFSAELGVGTRPLEVGQEPLPEPPAETVRRAMATAMGRLPTWQLTDELTSGEALRKLHGEVRAPSLEEAVAVGRLLGVDAVLRGHVRDYEERIGAEFAAKRAARVDFIVELVRLPAGDTVWRAEFAERQQALTDDLSNLFGFVRARGRWLRASELTGLGAAQVASGMHHDLYGGKATPVPAGR